MRIIRTSESRGVFTDSALFSRAEATNKFHPPAKRRHSPTRMLVEVNQHSVRVEAMSGGSKSRGKSNINTDTDSD